MDFGRRRAKRFLGASADSVVPFFGLGNPCLLAGLSETEGEKRGLVYLRKVAEMHGLCSSDALILHPFTIEVLGKTICLQEYLTAIPHTYASKKRDEADNRLRKVSHGRWLYIQRGSSITAEEHIILATQLQTKFEHIRNCAEVGKRILESPNKVVRKEWTWPRPPLLYASKKHPSLMSKSDFVRETYCCPSLADSGISCDCLDCDADTSAGVNSPIRFWSLWKTGGFELLIKPDAEYNLPNATSSTEEVPDLHPSASVEICTSHISPLVLAEYLHYSLSPCLEDKDGSSIRGRLKSFRRSLHYSLSQEASEQPEVPQHSNCIKQLAQDFPNCKKRLLALRALSLATETYLNLDGAMISTKVVGSPLDEALWLENQACDCLANSSPCQLDLSLP